MNKVKYKKIRGTNRRIRDIHQWGKYNLALDMDFLSSEQRDYVKFRVSPWSRLSMTNSVYPEPTGEMKILLIQYLIEIYHAWHARLSQEYDDFYVQIWLFENHISHSQVVCAVKDTRDFYDNTFELINRNASISNSQHYDNDTKILLDGFEWQLQRAIQGLDMNDEHQQEFFNSLPSDKHLGVSESGYQLVEIDKVWLIERKS